MVNWVNCVLEMERGGSPPPGTPLTPREPALTRSEPARRRRCHQPPACVCCWLGSIVLQQGLQLHLGIVYALGLPAAEAPVRRTGQSHCPPRRRRPPPPPRLPPPPLLATATNDWLAFVTERFPSNFIIGYKLIRASVTWLERPPPPNNSSPALAQDASCNPPFQSNRISVRKRAGPLGTCPQNSDEGGCGVDAEGECEWQGQGCCPGGGERGLQPPPAQPPQGRRRRRRSHPPPACHSRRPSTIFAGRGSG